MKAPEQFSIHPLYHSSPLRGPKLLGLEWSSRWTSLELSRCNQRMSGLGIDRVLDKNIYLIIWSLTLGLTKHIVFFFGCVGLKFEYFWHCFAKNILTYLIFNFAYPFWYHYALPFWYHYALPFWEHYALPFSYHYALSFWEHYALLGVNNTLPILAAHMAQQGLWSFFDWQFLAK